MLRRCDCKVHVLKRRTKRSRAESASWRKGGFKSISNIIIYAQTLPTFDSFWITDSLLFPLFISPLPSFFTPFVSLNVYIPTGLPVPPYLINCRLLLTDCRRHTTCVYQLQACVSKSVVALKGTPCDDIRRAYASCLNEDERQSKGRRLACNRQFVASLEECTAQHLGRLD